jgi:hypothetical protein
VRALMIEHGMAIHAERLLTPWRRAPLCYPHNVTASMIEQYRGRWASR